MAARGGFKRSIHKGCNAVYKYTCTPCGNDGKNIDAEFFCVDCGEHFCMLCIQHHNKFSMMKTHEVLNKAAMRTIGTQDNRPMLLTERCVSHRGNVIDTYCPVHEEVGCGTCIALNHRSCRGLTYIPDISPGITKTKAYKNIKSSINTIHTQLNTMKNNFNKDLEALANEKVYALNEIKTFREELNQELDRMEQNAISDLKAKHKDIEDQINTHVKRLENMLTTLESSLQNLENINLDNESEIFICVNRGEKNRAFGAQLVQKIGVCKAREKLTFQKNANFEKQIKNLKTLKYEPNDDLSMFAQALSIQENNLFDGYFDDDDDVFDDTVYKYTEPKKYRGMIHS